MSVEIQPTELVFRGPFDRKVEETLVISNDNSFPIVFQVKNTAPKTFGISKSHARIGPGTSYRIKVLVQSKDGHPLDVVPGLRFIVKSVAIKPDDDISDLHAFWSKVEASKNPRIDSKMIRAIFRGPEPEAERASVSQDPSIDDTIIAVMGATGSGKSSLVRLATGNEKVIVGCSLSSATSEVSSFSYHYAGRRFVLVDTPGFGDTTVSDEDILTVLSEWLTDSYREGKKVSAILYVHSISNPRMQGSVMGNFRVFRDLCGEDYFKRVHLCTTFWDLYSGDQKIPEARVEELKAEQFWGGMIRKGSQLCKAPTTQDEARLFFCKMQTERPTALQIQKEVVDQGKGTEKTTAMLGLMNLKLEQLKEEHEKGIQEAKAKWKREIAEKERQREAEMEKMRKALEAKLARQEDANRKAEIELKRTLSDYEEKQEQLRRQSESLQSRRKQAEEAIQFEQEVRTRRQKVDQFNNNIAATIRVLQTGKQNRHVRCDMTSFHALTRSYSIFCSNCLKTLGMKYYHRTTIPQLQDLTLNRG